MYKYSAVCSHEINEDGMQNAKQNV